MLSRAGLAAPTSQAPKKDSLEQDLIRGNIAVSEWIDSAAEQIDLFITGKKLTKELNKTRLRIENSTISREGEKPRNVTHVKFNLRLPNVEEYFQLMFSSYDEREERGVRRRYLHENRREENFGAGIGLFRNFGKVKTRFQPRVELRDPLLLSHSLSFEMPLESPSLLIFPKIEFFAHPEKGTGVFDILNFTFPLTKSFSFTLINESEYDDKQQPYFRSTNGISLNEVVNDKSFLTYSWLFDSNNLPHYHLDNYGLAIAWNQILYKRILTYQVVPGLNFAKTRAFKGEAGITFTLYLEF